MASVNKALEREFEEQLIDILEQDHDLSVRRHGDTLNRRRSDVATLHFSYDHVPKTTEAKVNVTIDGFDGFSMSLCVDFNNEESVLRSAEDTEGLALFLAEHLERRRSDILLRAAQGETPWGRREDD